MISSRKYVKTRAPLKEKAVRFKHWRVGIVPPTGARDSSWEQKCREYWELQQRVYGYRCSDFTMEFNTIDDPLVGGGTERYTVCTTSVVILEVLPGHRVEKHEWAKWRLANASVQ